MLSMRRPFLLLLVLAYQAEPVTAPTGFSFLQSPAASAHERARHNEPFSARNASSFASQMVLSIAIGAMAAGAHMCALSRPLHDDDEGSTSRPAPGSQRSSSSSSADDSDAPMLSRPGQLTDGGESSGEASSSSEDADDGMESGEMGTINAQQSTGKLWSTNEFPEGIKGAANWDLLNLAMAQKWRCPCVDRSCLSQERYPKVDPLYDFRKTFQTTSKKMGLRDTFRKKFLEPAFSPAFRSFSRSIRIGDLNDNCVVAAGLAAGLSFATFANARTDVTKSRPYHGGRVQQRDRLQSQQRQTIDHYVRDLRSTMEGDKGGQRQDVKWHTGKRSGVEHKRALPLPLTSTHV